MGGGGVTSDPKLMKHVHVMSIGHAYVEMLVFTWK